MSVVAVTVSSCTGLVPPEVTDPPSPTATLPPVDGSRLHLSDRQVFHGTGDHVFDLVEEAGGDGQELRVPPAGREFVELLAWQSPVGSAVVGGAVRSSIDVLAADGVVYRWKVQQLDRCGALKNESNYSLVDRDTGVRTADLELETVWEEGDFIRVSFEVREPDQRGESVAVAVSDPASYIEIQAGAIDLRQVKMVLDTPATPAEDGPYELLFERDIEVDGTDTSGLLNNEFRWNNLRVFWWNDFRKRWDGILPTAAPPAQAASDWWLWTDLGGEDPEPIAEVSGRTVNTPDTFWDQGCGALYVFMGRGSEGRSRFYRYLYEPAVDSYILDSPAEGVVVPEDLRGPKRVSIIRSPKGHLWASVNSGSRLLVSRSIDGGETWPDPVSITTTHGDGDTHWVVFEEDGQSIVGVAATEDGSIPGSRVRFLVIDEDEEWRVPANWTDESERIPGNEADERADDELSAIFFQGSVYLANETEPGPSSRRNQAPQLLLFRREAGGKWTKYVVARFERDGAADRKRPVITADAEQRRIIIGVGRGDRSVASLFYADVDDLDAWTELPIFAVGDTPGERIYNVWLPRYAVTSERGLLALVEEVGQTSGVWRQMIVLEGGS